MDINKRMRSHKNTEHYKKVKQAEIELDKRIRESIGQATETSVQTREVYRENNLGLLVWLIALLLLSIALFVGVPLPVVFLVLIFFVFPAICKCYGLIVAAFTIFSGIKLSFLGQYFTVAPVLPFMILNPSLSYFCIGWGLLAASRQSRSKLGFLLGIANLLGSGLGLFRFKQVTQIVAPGFWGSAISGLLTVSLGFSMIKVISDSWSKSTAH